MRGSKVKLLRKYFLEFCKRMNVGPMAKTWRKFKESKR